MDIDTEYNPFRPDIEHAIFYDYETSKIRLEKDKLILFKQLEYGHKNWVLTADEVKNKSQAARRAYWSLCYYNDFLLISIFDDQTKLALHRDEFVEISGSVRVLPFAIYPAGFTDWIQLQLVDERMLFNGASITVRSIRLVDFYNPKLYELIEKYDALLPHHFAIMGLDKMNMTVPLTGHKISLA
uniref:ORF22 n=1 Tax=Malaco herpesvirus 1 TaxID=3031797 RepID=A0AA48P7R1_9VIRU|nr:TPA_asm: ORF22 [Malaco herpesvirus 1]